jgi:hypothetical protein
MTQKRTGVSVHDRARKSLSGWLRCERWRSILRDFNPVKRRGEHILMNSRNYVGRSTVEAGKRVAFIVVAALALTLPLQSQQSAIGDSTEASGSVSQPASTASKQAQQGDPTAVKKWIEQPADKSLMDPSTIALDGGQPAVPSSNPGEPRLSTDCTGSGQGPGGGTQHSILSAIMPSALTNLAGTENGVLHRILQSLSGLLSIVEGW